MRYFVILLFMCLFGVDASRANNKILIVSSYGADYKWSNTIIDGIGQTLKASYPGVEINIEFLSSEFIADTELWGDKMNVLLDNYRVNPPRAIVLISDEAWMAYQEADSESFKGVPLVLCAVKPHSISIHDFAQKKDSLRLTHFTPTTQVMKRYTATGVLREMNVPGFLTLMNTLVKNLDRYVFVTDSRFYGVYTRMLLQQQVEQRYPDVPVEYLDARFVSTDSLLSRLPHIPSTAGLLMTSWLTGEHGFEYSKDYIYSQMATKLNTPIFITNNIGLEKEYFLGGYFNESSFWGEQAAAMLLDIFRGKDPKGLVPLVFHDDQCHLSWKVFKRFQLDPDLLPAKAYFYNKPDSFFVEYKYYLIGASVVFAIVLIIYLLTLRNNFKLQSTQRLLLQSIGETQKANTELEKTHQNLIVALRKAEESDRLKSAFLANMSHEIRTPLNAIVGFSAVVAELEAPEDRMELAGHIQHNSDLLLQLISDILDISKIEANALTLSYDWVYAAEVCTNVLVSLQAKCKPNVKMFLHEPAPPILLYTDQYRLMQVIINLVNNAIKFTPQGSIEVGYCSHDSKWVEFFVQDTGIGISEEQLVLIFNRFVKLNSYVEGTGLGLPISQMIVEMMGGTIGVDSVEGKGSRFWFRIPLDDHKKEEDSIA